MGVNVDTFDFPYHVVKTQYPQSSNSMKFGNSYQFTAKPNAPIQRIFILSFAGMRYFFDSSGNVSNSITPKVNYKTFQEFYEAHELWDTFIYPHPIHGNINVKFAEPLADPDPIPEGDGAQGAFEIKLEEQP